MRRPGPRSEKLPSASQLLDGFPLFLGLTSPVIRKLGQASVVRKIARGDVLLREGDPPRSVFALVKGAVRVFYSSAAGGELLAKLFAAPSFFGEMEAIARLPHLESVEVARSGVVVILPWELFGRALEQEPKLTLRLLGDVCRRLCIAAQNERSLAFNQVERRVAGVLLSYARVFGVRVMGGIQIVHAVSQASVAEDLSVSRKSVQRTFEAWAEAGILARRGRYYLLTDTRALRRIAGLGAPKLAYTLEGRLSDDEPTVG